MRWTVFNTALFFDRLARIVPVWLYGCGAALLIAKIVRPDGAGPGTASAIALVLLCVCVVADLFRQGGRWYDAAYAMAWLDLRNHAGGEIMAGNKAALERAKIVPAVSLGPFLRGLIMPLLFLAAICFAPMPAPARAISGAGVERAVAAMANRVREAENGEAIPKPDAEALHERLRQLETVARRDPAAAAEALAALSGRLEAAAADRLDRGDAALDKIRDAMQAAESAERGDGDAAEFEAAAGAALSAMEDIVKAEGGLDNLDPELREALANALAGAEGRAYADPPPEGDLRRLSEALEKILDRQEAAAMACDCLGGSYIGERGENGTAALSESGASPYGRGGIDQGGGATPLLFGGETEEAGARFERKALPKSAGGAPGQTLERRRVRPGEAMPPEEFRTTIPGGHAVPERVRAGSGAASLSPGRSRAAEEYFRRLANDGNVAP